MRGNTQARACGKNGGAAWDPALTAAKATVTHLVRKPPGVDPQPAIEALSTQVWSHPRWKTGKGSKPVSTQDDSYEK